ncbi:hypothetical protein ACJX0J_037888, partial [Zea mays]
GFVGQERSDDGYIIQTNLHKTFNGIWAHFVGFPEFLKSVTSIDCRFWYSIFVGGQLMTSPVFMYNPIAVGLLMIFLLDDDKDEIWASKSYRKKGKVGFLFSRKKDGFLLFLEPKILNAAIFQATDIMHKDKEIISIQ